MRIAFFIGSMGRGGAERVISILANEYADKGWDVDILMLLANRVEYDLRPQINVLSLIGTSTSYAKNALFWLTKIRKYVSTVKPDRVVSFIGRVNAVVLTATIGMKVPIIVSERNDPKHDGRGKAMLWYCNTIYHRAKAIVFQNKYERSCFNKSLESKGVIVPNPVQVSATKKCDGEEFVVATAGRLNHQKNHFMLIDAMELIHEKHPYVRCRIYGEGDLRNELQAYIDNKGLNEAVSLEGNCTDIHERLSECSMFVLTSEFEGLSNALIEAMMIGLPCVTTNYNGAEEIVRDGENGLIVGRGKANELADAIIQLLQNPSLRIAIIKKSQESAKEYMALSVLKKWKEVIECER